MTNPSISMIQTGLRDLGHAPGAVDGLYGPKTRAAAEAWIQAGGKAKSALLKPVTTGMIYQGSVRYPVDEIIVHCSDTPPKWMADAPLADQVDEMRRWHVEERGWKDIGYHWIVGRKGQILPGRKETTVGSHCLDHNAGTIGICLIGGKGSNSTDAFTEHFTAAQDATLRQLIEGIGMRTRIERVSGHNDYAARACPGFDVSIWFKGNPA